MIVVTGISGTPQREQTMPFIRITALGPTLTAEQISRLQNEVTNLMESVLGKVANLTSVLVEQPPVAGWSIGRKAMRVAVHVHATITAGTNSTEEKASFIDKIMQLLKSVFGSELSTATYIVVDEVPAQSWGYDGRTQDARRLAAAPL